MDGRGILKRILAIAGIAIVLGYSYFVLNDYIRGPRIIIESPLNGYSTTTPAIMIIGRVIHTNNLSVNDARIPVDLEGNFHTQLILATGYNIIKISAKDNYGRNVEKTIEMNLVVEHLTTDTATRTIDENAGTTGTTVGTTTVATTTPMELTAPKGLLPTGQETTDTSASPL